MTMKPIKYSDIPSPVYDIKPDNYENIFSICKDDGGKYYYNLLKKVDFPDDMDSNVYDNYEVRPKDSYHLIAYKVYKTSSLWWLICAVNNIDDPTALPEVGTIIKILLPEYVTQVISAINTQS